MSIPKWRNHARKHNIGYLRLINSKTKILLAERILK